MSLVAGLGMLLLVLFALGCAIRAARALDRGVESLLETSAEHRARVERSIGQVAQKAAALDAQVVPIQVVRRKPRRFWFVR